MLRSLAPADMLEPYGSPLRQNPLEDARASLLGGVIVRLAVSDNRRRDRSVRP